MRRALLVVAALAIPISGVTVALSNPAFAKGKPKPIECKTLSGTEASDSFSNCTGGATGGSSTDLGTALEGGGTIIWTSGSTTTVGAPNIKTIKSKKCPGGSAAKVSGAVTGDTGDNIAVPGKFSGEVCLSEGGTLSALKPFKFS